VSFLTLNTLQVSSASCLQRITTPTISAPSLVLGTLLVSRASCPQRTMIPTISVPFLALTEREDETDEARLLGNVEASKRARGF
ncbi:MAG: hypothetical protein M3305_12625, partial [Actinomycetota bacterium]|nr:hypothetical protein [Actinomycetota bacterium]